MTAALSNPPLALTVKIARAIETDAALHAARVKTETAAAMRAAGRALRRAAAGHHRPELAAAVITCARAKITAAAARLDRANAAAVAAAADADRAAAAAPPRLTAT